MSTWKRILIEGDAGVTSIDVAGGTGLSSSGGPVTASGTITVSLDNTSVTAGSYTSADITVDAQGRITSASNGAGGSDTNIANTDLTANDNRTYDTDGNTLTVDINGGEFVVSDSSSVDTYLTCSTNVVELGDAGMVIASQGLFQAKNGVEQDEANLNTTGQIGAGAEVTYMGSSTTSVSTGRVYYWSGATWVAYTSATETPQQALLGIAMGSTMAKGFCLKGFIHPDSGTLTAGAQVFGATNASVVSTAPTSGFQRIIGHAISTSVIYFNPSSEYIDLA